ncbi:MAG: metallophosphoesterase [bacterium]
MIASLRIDRGAFAVAALVLAASAWSVPARATSYVYVSEGYPLSYLPGTGPPDALWTEPDFVPGGQWVDSPSGFGIGYGDGDDNTVLSGMQNSYVTVYVRATFTAGLEIGALTHLELGAWFDDGFVAYLNGVEIARSSVPAGALAFDTTANVGHEATDGEVVFSVDPGLLLPGDNVLAVEVHNVDPGSSDLSFIPTLWGYDSPPEDAEITVGPYLQRLGRRGVFVCWETDIAAPSQISIGAGQNPDQVLEDPTETTRHEFAVSGLFPAQTYSYRVESARLPSATGVFHTETDAADPYRFVVYGDTRSNHDDHRSVVDRIVAEAPAFLVHTGDLVGDGELDTQWTTFFDVEAALLLDVPLYPTLGNHEGNGARYLELFAPPDDLSPTVENYYAYTYATTAFLIVDLYRSSFAPGSDQYNWLETTLQGFAADPAVHLRFVALHGGPYDSGPHGSNLSVRSDLVPLFEANGVDAVFSGHDHMYERSTVNGIKYVVTGGGGAPLYAVSGDWWTEVAESVLHYVVIDVEGPRASVTIRRVDGTVLDQFALGEGASDCSVATDCAARPTGVCEPDEDGAWVCVHSACVWNCALRDLPDAGIGPTLDGGIVVGPDSGTAPPPGDDGGCGCRHTTSGGTGPIVVALLLGLCWLARRRRREDLKPTNKPRQSAFGRARLACGVARRSNIA